MSRTQINLFLAGLIFAVTLPAMSALIYYKISGDPTFRPLGITVASLTEGLIGSTSRGITVRIEWGENANTSTTQAQVYATLENALALYPMDFLVRFHNNNGSDIRVYFVVEGSRIGPYRLQNISSGIPAALAAFNMTKRQQPESNAWKF